MLILILLDYNVILLTKPIIGDVVTRLARMWLSVIADLRLPSRDEGNNGGGLIKRPINAAYLNCLEGNLGLSVGLTGLTFGDGKIHRGEGVNIDIYN